MTLLSRGKKWNYKLHSCFHIFLYSLSWRIILQYMFVKYNMTIVIINKDDANFKTPFSCSKILMRKREVLLKIENLATRLEKGSPALVCTHHVGHFATIHLTAAPLRHCGGVGGGKIKRKRKKIKIIIDNWRKRRNT